MRLAKGVKVGVVKVNKPSIGLEPWVPYGGVKGSGNDAYKEMGEEAIEFFTRVKAICRILRQHTVSIPHT
jgi:aldehyde dehydrogenase (NAD+)